MASPGYFSTNLSNSIRVELTSTRRTALHRYTFPSSSTHPRILIDVTNDGQVSGINPEMEIDPSTGRITGTSRLAIVAHSIKCLTFISVNQQAAILQSHSAQDVIMHMPASISKGRDSTLKECPSMGHTRSIIPICGGRIFSSTIIVCSFFIRV